MGAALHTERLGVGSPAGSVCVCPLFWESSRKSQSTVICKRARSRFLIPAIEREKQKLPLLGSHGGNAVGFQHPQNDRDMVPELCAVRV